MPRLFSATFSAPAHLSGGRATGCALLLLAALLAACPAAAEPPTPPAATGAHALNEQVAAQFAVSPARALELARQAESTARSAGDSLELTQAVAYQGTANYYLERYDEALRHYLRALTLSEKRRDLKGQSACLNNVGNVYLTRNQAGSALGYYRRSLVLDRQRGDSVGVGVSYMAIAGALSEMAPEQALANYQQALRLFRQAGDRANQIMALSNIGDAYNDLHRYAEARPYFEQCAQLNHQAGNVQDEAINLLNLGETYRGLRNWPRAAAIYGASLALAREFPIVRRDNHRALADLYTQTGDYRQALSNYRQYVALKDSVFSRENTDRLNELETRFRTQQKERQIQVQQLTIRRKNQLIYASLAATALLLTFAGSLGYQIRQRSKANRALAQANREIRQSVVEKEVLIQEIHHRVKNNLQLISSLLSWQAGNLPELAQPLSESQARIQSMALVHEYLYRADNLAQVSLDTYLEELLNSLHASHTTSRQPIALHLDLAPVVMEAKEAIPFGLLVNELVTNAYKHAFRDRASGSLAVRLRPRPGGGFELQVEDDGVGIAATDPAEAAALRPTSLGMQLARMLTRQLKAKLAIAHPAPPATGTRFDVVK